MCRLSFGNKRSLHEIEVSRLEGHKDCVYRPGNLLGSLTLSSNAKSGNWFIKSVATLRTLHVMTMPNLIYRRELSESYSTSRIPYHGEEERISQ